MVLSGQVIFKELLFMGLVFGSYLAALLTVLFMITEKQKRREAVSELEKKYYISAESAAAAAKMSKDALSLYRWRKKLGCKIGKEYRYSEKDLEVLCNRPGRGRPGKKR